MNYLKMTRDQIVKGVQNNTINFSKLPEKLRNDKNVVLDAIKNDSCELFFASKKLKNNKKFVLKIVKDYKYTFKYVSKNLKNDKDVALAAVKRDCWALEFVSDKLKNDKEIVYNAIKENHNLFTTLLDLRIFLDDKDIVLLAVKGDGNRLMVVDSKLKNDKEVVIEAVKENGFSLYYASEFLQDDKECLELLEKIDAENWDKIYLNWYKERMEILANIRRHEEKEFMEKSIISSNILPKKVKF